jgi:hypothetical protein
MMFIYDSDEFVNLNKVLIFNMVRRSVCVCFFITGFHSWPRRLTKLDVSPICDSHLRLTNLSESVLRITFCCGSGPRGRIPSLQAPASTISAEPADVICLADAFRKVLCSSLITAPVTTPPLKAPSVLIFPNPASGFCHRSCVNRDEMMCVDRNGCW